MQNLMPFERYIKKWVPQNITKQKQTGAAFSESFSVVSFMVTKIAIVTDFEWH